MFAGLGDWVGALDRSAAGGSAPLARLTSTSTSRLSHAVAALEERGWVARTSCETDRRGQLAELTAAGRRMLEQTAPGHVAEVRRRVFDVLDDEELTQLRTLAAKLSAAAEA